jgi:hypothetical protein
MTGQLAGAGVATAAGINEVPTEKHARRSALVTRMQTTTSGTTVQDGEADAGPLRPYRVVGSGAQRTASVSAVTCHMTGPPTAGDVIIPPVVHAQYTPVP